jgi:hypothetical protein
MPGAGKVKSAEKKLLALFGQLDSSGQETLLAFAEFLVERGKAEQHVQESISEPDLIPRPENESVVAAIKRLSASYPMLDTPQLLNETSALMTKHVMQGMSANEVIDELEALFSRFYNEMVEDFAKGK